MSLSKAQQEDTSFSMTSFEAQPEDPKSEEELNAITYLNATTSPLLLLPAEIRNMILALALNHQDIMIIRGRMYNEIRSPVNLLHVCRHIHAETALLPYKLNFFAIAECDRRLSPFLERRTQAQLSVMTGPPEFQMTDTVDEEVLAMRECLEYEGKHALATKRIFKHMDVRLLDQLQVLRQRGWV